MKKSIFLLSVLFLFSSCQRENLDEITDSSQSTLPNVTLESSVVGFVLDEDGNGLMGATVSLGSFTTTTNEIGVFSFVDQLMSKNSSYVLVQKDGYFLGSRKFSTELDGQANITIQLIEAELTEVISAQTGGEVNIESSSIDLPQGDYITQDGASFSGQVGVYAKWLDPTDPATFDQMPGELTGVDTEGNLNALATFGMIAVELRNESGEYLNLPEGKTATIRMEVPNELLGFAPSTIPLWHFNDLTGNWEEEGEANLVGNQYVGEVDHFSFWNCDLPLPLVEITGTIESNSSAYEGAKFKIMDLNSGFCAFSYSGEGGYFAGKVPAGGDLLIYVYGGCGQVIDVIEIGAIFENTNLGTIAFQMTLETVTVSGTFENCMEGNFELSFVFVETSDAQYAIQVNSDGSFSQEFPACGTPEVVDVYGVDFANLLISEVQQSFFNGELDLQIEACEEFIEPEVFIDYEGKSWNSTDSLFQLIVEIDTSNIGPQQGYICEIGGIDFDIFLEEFMPVFQGTIFFEEGAETGEYDIIFPTQGFSISGQCDVEVIEQGLSNLIRFQDIFEGEPFILDPETFPEELEEVIFDISFLN